MADFRLSDTVNAPEALLQSVGIPRQVIIDHQVRPLKVNTLACRIRRQQDEHIRVVQWFKGVQAAEEFLFAAQVEDWHGLPCIGHPGEEILTRQLALGLATQHSAEGLARHLADRYLHRRAIDLKEAIQIARDLLWIDEKYAQDFIQSTIQFFVPPPALLTDVLETWDAEPKSTPETGVTAEKLAGLLGHPVNESALVNLKAHTEIFINIVMIAEHQLKQFDYINQYLCQKRGLKK